MQIVRRKKKESNNNARTDVYLRRYILLIKGSVVDTNKYKVFKCHTSLLIKGKAFIKASHIFLKAATILDNNKGSSLEYSKVSLLSHCPFDGEESDFLFTKIHFFPTVLANKIKYFKINSVKTYKSNLL